MCAAGLSARQKMSSSGTRSGTHERRFCDFPIHRQRTWQYKNICTNRCAVSKRHLLQEVQKTSSFMARKTCLKRDSSRTTFSFLVTILDYRNQNIFVGMFGTARNKVIFIIFFRYL